MLCSTLLHSMSGATEYASFFTNERRRDVLRGMFESYYAASTAAQVIFDTNRSWTGRLPLLAELYPSARMICCVREVSWIIDSIERLVRRNMLQPSKLFNYKNSGSVYTRVETLMDPEKGLVGLPWSTLREAWFGNPTERLIVVDYNSLAQAPQRVLARIYDFLEEPVFEHDFSNVRYDEPTYDADLGIPGLHRVRSRVALEQRLTCLPPDLFAKYADSNFWLNPKLNSRHITVV